mmetsp:Transcript_34333/g.60117  ORF Transcript_34333/g.60117 Transcript_34333/m.60117 type:complete len:175 (+) Transcript_34333:122-646(+)
MLGAPNRNKYLVLAEQEHQSHSRRLKEVRSCMRLTKPPEFTHLRKKPIDPMRTFQIDYQNRKIKDKITELVKSKTNTSIVGFRHTSLNKKLRDKEQLRIEHENKGYKKRLEHANSSYQLKTFLDQRKDNERIIKTRCIYPDAPLLKKIDPELVHTEDKTIDEVACNIKIYRIQT